MGSKKRTEIENDNKSNEEVSNKKIKKEKHMASATEKADDPWWAENKVRLSQPVEEWVKFMDFDSANFSKKLTKYIKGKFETPTPIQSAAWPLVYEQRRDVVGIAKTGSGKTLAFVMPYLALSEKGILDYYEPTNHPRMLALAPTRELAIQIAEVAKEFSAICKGNYPTHTILGGMPKHEQKSLIAKEGLDICVATPGRLMDLCNEEAINLHCVQFLCLDEADRMLDMGFIDEVRKIVALTPDEKQTVMFSATWPLEVNKLAKRMTKKPVHIYVGQDIDDKGELNLTLNEKISQTIHVMKDDRSKYSLLTKELDRTWGQKILVFALYKKEAARLEERLNQNGYGVKAIQGDMTQDKRCQVMESFKAGTLNILVATDVAGRGLDIPDVKLVINYTFPLTVEDFVHRCGRTGRGGKSGEAITFFNEGGDFKEKERCYDLIRVLKEAKQKIPPELELLNSNTFTASKKKEHPIYGKFYKSEAEMAKLGEKKVHKTFSDSEEE